VPLAVASRRAALHGLGAQPRQDAPTHGAVPKRPSSPSPTGASSAPGAPRCLGEQLEQDAWGAVSRSPGKEILDFSSFIDRTAPCATK
jgi:hypothetical protein